MEFTQALSIKEKNKYLIGKKNNGACIDELILVPTNNKVSEEFFKIYLQLLDGDKAIIPYSGFDVDIVVVFDKKRICEGVFSYMSIFNLPKELGIIEE